MKRIAYYGGTFDPVHTGHLTVASTLLELFSLDEFVFIPAYHAPHKPDSKPTSAYHRYAMLCLATEEKPKIGVSLMEIETGAKRYSLDTLSELKRVNAKNRMFFVMGADSWTDIRTWREWENVLLMTNHIVVSRPGYKIETDHVTDDVRNRLVDLRALSSDDLKTRILSVQESDHIFLTDAVRLNVSATEIREDIMEDDVLDRTSDVPAKVAKYIEKYELYK